MTRLSPLSAGPITGARTAATSARSLVRRRRGTDVSAVDPSAIEAVLDRYDDDTVFVHAGLSDVKAAFRTDPYEFLRGVLTDHFESVLAPGFTPSFKESGVFHKHYSRPRYGAFPRLFLSDCDHRTDDPLHSILVEGPYRFDGSDPRTTFGPNGRFARLAADDVLYLSVGTPWFRATQLHYLECKYDVPYVEQTDHEGVVYHDETEHERVVQTNYTNENPYLYAFNKTKLERRLRDAGALDRYDLGGLRVYLTRAGELERVLGPELERDPYYLIS